MGEEDDVVGVDVESGLVAWLEVGGGERVEGGEAEACAIGESGGMLGGFAKECGVFDGGVEVVGC